MKKGYEKGMVSL